MWGRKIEHNTRFGRLLREKNITETELASMLNLHKNTIYNYVSGKTKTPRWIIKFVEEYLDIIRENYEKT